MLKQRQHRLLVPPHLHRAADTMEPRRLRPMAVHLRRRQRAVRGMPTMTRGRRGFRCGMYRPRRAQAGKAEVATKLGTRTRVCRQGALGIASFDWVQPCSLLCRLIHLLFFRRAIYTSLKVMAFCLYCLLCLYSSKLFCTKSEIPCLGWQRLNSKQSRVRGIDRRYRSYLGRPD